jgi:hypothetical protein
MSIFRRHPFGNVMRENDDRYSIDGMRAVPAPGDVICPPAGETGVGRGEHLFHDLAVLSLWLEPPVAVYAGGPLLYQSKSDMPSRVPRGWVKIVIRTGDEAVQGHREADDHLPHIVPTGLW